MKKNGLVGPLTKGAIGLMLLLSAGFFAFMLTTGMIFGYTRLYYQIAPALLGRNSAYFSFGAGTLILYGPAFCLVLNLPISYRNSFFSDSLAAFKTFYRLNTRICLRALILFVLTSSWFFFQHC